MSNEYGIISNEWLIRVCMFPWGILRRFVIEIDGMFGCQFEEFIGEFY